MVAESAVILVAPVVHWTSVCELPSVFKISSTAVAVKFVFVTVTVTSLPVPEGLSCPLLLKLISTLATLISILYAVGTTEVPVTPPVALVGWYAEVINLFPLLNFDNLRVLDQ